MILSSIYCKVLNTQKNYSEIKFNSVKVGTNYEQVIGILGTPLRVIYDADGRTLKIVDYVGHDEKNMVPGSK